MSQRRPSSLKSDHGPVPRSAKADPNNTSNGKQRVVERLRGVHPDRLNRITPSSLVPGTFTPKPTQKLYTTKTASTSSVSTTMNSEKVTSRLHLEKIEFLDGDKQIGVQLPRHLVRDLEDHLECHGTTTITCARSTGWDNSFPEQDGRETVFRPRHSDKNLLAARYKYGARAHILVVQERIGKSINDGRAVIIVSAGPPSTRVTRPDGTIWNEVEYHIWDPVLDIKQRSRAKAEIVKQIRARESLEEQRQGHEPSGVERGPMVYGDNDDIVTNAAGFAGLLNTQRSPDNDTITVRGEKRATQRGSIVKTHKRSFSSAEISARSSSAEPLVAKRSKNISSATPEMSNALASKPTSSQASTCTDTVPPKQSPQADQLPSSSPIPKEADPGFCQHKSTSFTPVPCLQPNSMAPVTLPVNTSSSFVFKQALGGPRKRTRDKTACNTIQKLFAHGKVAGIVTKDTTTLVLFVDGQEPVTVVRDDAEDFDTFLRSLRSEPEGPQEIVVLPDEE
ncbi:hypothetical protein OHC33_004791 [Knufia fluminis]|uniref:Uncharacterized protein n=1 Tax=Knufia fluminis TaxID=191047 RepID=A0AAN8ELR4_9EURO|nr:hypothetical protein OHC33_004791 [Knufia fluminis]